MADRNQGSRQYVEKMVTLLGARLQLNTAVAAVSPGEAGVRVTLQSGAVLDFDDVILATHSDTSRRLMGTSGDDRVQTLKDVRYRPNQIYLHRDPSLMPHRKAAWASWNVLKQDGPDICLSYWMNRLQNIDKSTPIFVTLNPESPPQAALTFAQFEKAHPQFDAPALSAVQALKTQQGQNNIWLAGAWMGSGFHEDGLKSGLSCALALGGQVPWDTATVEAITQIGSPVPAAVQAVA